MKRVVSRFLLAAGSLLPATAAFAQVPPPPSHLTGGGSFTSIRRMLYLK